MWRLEELLMHWWWRHLLLGLLLHVRVVALVDDWHSGRAHRLLLPCHCQIGVARSELLLLLLRCLGMRWLVSWRAWLRQELDLAGKRAPAYLFLDGLLLFVGPTALMDVEHGTSSRVGTTRLLLIWCCLVWLCELSAFTALCLEE